MSSGIVRPRNFVKIMDTILPPLNGGKKLCKFNAPYNEPRVRKNRRGIHGGVDMSYTPGSNKAGIYKVYTPIAGTVLAAGGGNVNAIAILDAKGYTHCFFHNHDILVKKDQSVGAGTVIATEGGERGYAVHVHYAIYMPGKYGQGSSNPNAVIDPIKFWNNEKQLFLNIPRDEEGNPEPSDPESDVVTAKDITESTEEYNNQHTEAAGSTVADYRPRMAATAEASGALGALLPNRVPLHEPWPRVMNTNTPHINGVSEEVNYNTRLNLQLDPESDAGEKLIGKVEGPMEIERGPFWRR